MRLVVVSELRLLVLEGIRDLVLMVEMHLLLRVVQHVLLLLLVVLLLESGHRESLLKVDVLILLMGVDGVVLLLLLLEEGVQGVDGGLLLMKVLVVERIDLSDELLDMEGELVVGNGVKTESVLVVLAELVLLLQPFDPRQPEQTLLLRWSTLSGDKKVGSQLLRTRSQDEETKGDRRSSRAPSSSPRPPSGACSCSCSP